MSFLVHKTLDTPFWYLNHEWTQLSHCLKKLDKTHDFPISMQFATYEQTHKTLCKDTIHILNTKLIIQINLNNFLLLFKFENYYKKVNFFEIFTGPVTQ